MVYRSIGFSYLTTIDAAKDSDIDGSPRYRDEARGFTYRGECSRDESNSGASSEPYTPAAGYQQI